MIQTECGILYYYNFDNFNNPSLTNIINIFKKLNHRGRDCFGIIGKNIDNTHIYKKEGLITDTLFTNQELSTTYQEYICHNRYATSGCEENLIKYCQPMYSENVLGSYYLIFNGNIPDNVWAKFSISTEFSNEKNDTVKLIYYINEIAKFGNNITWYDVIHILLEELPCAYSICIITSNKTYFFKDTYNFKPLCYATINYEYHNKTESYDTRNEYNNTRNEVYISSESCIFQDEYFKDLEITINQVVPGTIYVYDKDKNKVITYPSTLITRNNKCSFEAIYFMKERSHAFIEYDNNDYTNSVNTLSQHTTSRYNITDNSTIEELRFNLGIDLFDTFKTDYNLIYENVIIQNPIVCGVPNSGMAYGHGFSKVSGFEYKQIIKKNKEHLGERTFILDNQEKRDSASSKKYLYEYNELDITRPLIVIDDSIVRGTTMNKLLTDLKEIGFKIYLFSGSPPICNECNYGVNMGSKTNLLINNVPRNKIADYYGIEFVMYNTKKSLKNTIADCCTQCMSNDETSNNIGDIEDLF